MMMMTTQMQVQTRQKQKSDKKPPKRKSSTGSNSNKCSKYKNIYPQENPFQTWQTIIIIYIYIHTTNHSLTFARGSCSMLQLQHAALFTFQPHPSGPQRTRIYPPNAWRAQRNCMSCSSRGKVTMHLGQACSWVYKLQGSDSMY